MSDIINGLKKLTKDFQQNTELQEKKDSQYLKTLSTLAQNIEQQYVALRELGMRLESLEKEIKYNKPLYKKVWEALPTCCEASQLDEKELSFPGLAEQNFNPAYSPVFSNGDGAGLGMGRQRYVKRVKL